MKKLIMPALALCAAFGMTIAATSAQAQATRTWVSGVGDDANPCSRTAPCKTFAGAISKTAAGGEINCLDPGGMGQVTITKSMTISCEAGTAGVLASVNSGIVVNDGGVGTVLVVLRGLDIDGVGTGGIGVNVISAARVTIENTTIKNFRSGTAAGVAVSGTLGMTIVIDNTMIENNGTGVSIDSSGAFKVVDVNRSTIFGSSGNGLNAASGVSIANVVNSVIASNGQNGVVVNSGSGFVSVDRTQILNNVTAGLNTNVAGATINATNNKLYGNTSAYSHNNGVINSDGSNIVGPGQGGTTPNGAVTKN